MPDSYARQAIALLRGVCTEIFVEVALFLLQEGFVCDKLPYDRMMVCRALDWHSKRRSRLCALYDVSGRCAAGSAPALGAGGRWFESSRSDHGKCPYGI